MITACDTQDFVPFGREYVQQHPGKFQIQVQNVVHTDPGLPLLKSFRDISIQDSGKKEQWTFYTELDKDGCRGSYDEELYVSGNTVVWSKGGQDGCRSVIKTFTMDSPVLQALWCKFVIPESSNPEEICSTLDTEGEMQSGVCVVESSCVSCFMEDGSDYLAALPFQVAHVWVIKNGLLFERTVSPTEYSSQKRNAPNQTTVFSMLHPLDEVAPVITKTGTAGCQKTSYLTDNTQHVVFSSIDPSIVLTYDTMVGVHSAWKVRRARQEECNAVCNTWDQTASIYQMGPCTPAQNLNQSSSNMSRFYGNISASPQVSPLRSYSGRISSPAFMSHSQSPLIGNPPGIDRRSQSPALLGSTSLLRLHTPSPQTSKSPGNFYRTPANMSLINESFTEWMEPITPEICLEHIWTETAPAIRDGSLGKSSKAFLTRDLCGQQYLCYVISYRQQLRCVKFEESNDLKKLVFGAVNIIPCKDAVPIESKDLLIVLDTSGCLFMYSGTAKINRLHVPTLPVGNMSVSILRQMTPLHSPVRGGGGVFTSSRPPSAMDARFDEEFQLNQISPVQTELEESANYDDFPLGCGYIQNLRDNISDRFTIELTNGQLCRCTIPDMTNSPGIDIGLKALKHMLPRDLALQMLGRWYTVRNSPGGIGSQSEWMMFIRCLLGMMGYDTAKLALTFKQEMDMSLSPVSAKRAKTSDQGSEEDWEWMLSSDHHKFVSETLDDALGLSGCHGIPEAAQSHQATVNMSAILFSHIPACFMALHLVYEELKLNSLLVEDLEQLVTLLHQLAVDLRCNQYVDYYCRDFPKLIDTASTVSQVKDEHLEKMQYPSVFTKIPPSVYKWIITSLQGQKSGHVIYIPLVCNNILNVVSLYALLLNKHMGTEQAIDRCLKKVPPSGHRAPTCDISMSRSFCRASPTHNYLERVVLYMTQLGMTERDLTYLPVGIALPIREAIFHCRCNPPSDWPEEAYTLTGREDISKLLSLQDREDVSPPPGIFKRKPSPQSQGTKEEDDGMEHLDDEYLRLRFSEDLRVQEARRLLHSSRPARISLVQKPEISDHDFIEEQERHLYAICIRTMALSVGRGMFTLSTYHPLPTETLPIPKLCLTGKAPPRNTTVDLSHIDTPPNMTAWPLFHNGVAAGLRIADFSQVDSSWIMYNRPKSNELTNEYAGFLMALGLNKHLVKMNILNKHNYLSKGHEMTTIGLLLGIAAAKRSTMDLATMKMLSIHLPAMLPPTSTELNVSHNVQVAAILGVGLVFQGTGHRHTADILLAEIGRPPGPELQNCNDRESYSLAAGLALGLVMFGKGKETMGTSDLSMADTLYHFMVGGHKRPLIGPSQERYKTPSYQIQEGDTVNVDVTSPGATLALGMLYFNTKNSAVSEWLKVPDTQFMLDQVRPDFLLLRTLARGLVMWDSVLPSVDFLKETIPKILEDYAFHKYQMQDDDNNIDFETMSQAYCNVVAGACMVIGLKFAGSANQEAFDTLVECMNRSLKIISTPPLVEQAGKSTVENCMMTILMSMAMVMAGTGNLEVLRMCRMFRSRVGPPYNLYVMYGSHIAISMAIGLLFLGGGKYTLSTKDEAIAVMLCAFFPKFPTHSNDNRYHLQAFRHLYVLAAELRTMLPRDVDTGFPCYVPIEIRFKDTEHYFNESYKTSAPCILPELDLLQEIKILGPRYWPIVFHKDKNWNSLKLLLKHNGTLYVKQRAGHLSYVEDPKGYRSMLAKSLTVDQSSQTCVKPDVIKAFTSDTKVVALTEYFFSNHDNTEDLLQVLSDVLYECVTLEKPEALSTHITLDQVTRRSEFQWTSLGVSQLKLIYAYYNLEHSSVLTGTEMLDQSAIQEEFQGQQLLKPEFILSMKNRLKNVLDKWLNENLSVLVKYIKGESVRGSAVRNLSAVLVWYDIPSPSDLAHISIEGVPSLPTLYAALPQLHVSTLMMLLNAWKTDR
ncbi:anaphase-promoting complex subunit 1-like [Mercenaria mercenaria]|uniref:anaphase-promoting complex subunit 1-like n=1 Tax=Mercenaria mercenaria TaxID=6596 RepID=UPI00234F5587|nr:anaphase-promoting complex subunit 1-like [Mercenaria mercenaria]XP_053374222.1 anaphase-promoting complex subunit 1-like [Mercenaria mercenaria]